jgi:murein DD-endopeptidase MepM/ murein hydrolase activator NlpD
VVDTFIHAMIGGTASVLGGGKFASGAQSGAFGYLFNEVAHRMGGSYGAGIARDRRIYSAESGVVETAGWENPGDHTQGYGFRLKVRMSSDQSLFVYAHVDPNSIQVFEGLVVAKGQYIGEYASPANGGATGPHLHFEWWSKNGTRLDPAANLPTVMPEHVLKDTIRFRNVHPVTGAAQWHNGYDLVGPTGQ